MYLRLKGITGIALVFVCMMVFSGSAHDLWISPSEYKLKRDDTVKLQFPSAHIFPATAGNIAEKDSIIATFIINPAGKKLNMTSWKGDVLESRKLTLEGTYLIVSGNKGGFYTKTSDGKSEKKSKDRVKNAVKSVFSKKFTKAIITVGSCGGDSFKKATGQELEIIPMNDPGLLKKGNSFNIRVFLNGKPYETEVLATYAGYSTEENKFAQSVKTDSSGSAKIKLSETGAWLLKVSNKIPYRDLKKADEQSYTATLTFKIN